MTGTVTDAAAVLTWRASLLAALPSWVLARLLVAAGWVVAHLAVTELAVEGRRPIADGVFAWDGTFYRLIAEGGYEAGETLRFFPLYSLLGRVLAVPLLGNEELALLLLANGFALLTAVLVHRLVVKEGFGAEAATRAVWFTALFPASFVLTWAYSEPLMLAASVGCFLALRQGRFGVAGALGMVAALSRPLGVVLALPAAIEALRGAREAGWGERARHGIAIAGPLAGTSLYLWWSSVAGFGAWEPIDQQQGLRGDAIDPFSRVWQGISELTGADALTDGLHVIFAIGLVALLVLTVRHLPASYSAYAGVVLVIALGAENLNSLERYGLNAFPLVLALGIACRHPVVERLGLGASAGGILAFSALAWMGIYVP